MLKSFAPVVDDETEVMVIGTMPGEASLKAQEYYAYKHNLFWVIMAELLNDGEAFADYKSKLECLKRNHIGLWDNLQYCERKGSLDSNIKNARPNDFAALLKKYPKVRRLIFNGQQSYKFFRKFHSQLMTGVECLAAPSTSPANASVRPVEKLAVWREVLDF